MKIEVHYETEFGVKSRKLNTEELAKFLNKFKIVKTENCKDE